MSKVISANRRYLVGISHLQICNCTDSISGSFLELVHLSRRLIELIQIEYIPKQKKHKS